MPPDRRFGGREVGHDRVIVAEQRADPPRALGREQRRGPRPGGRPAAKPPHHLPALIIQPERRRGGEPLRGEVGEQALHGRRPGSGGPTHRFAHPDDPPGLQAAQQHLLGLRQSRLQKELARMNWPQYTPPLADGRSVCGGQTKNRAFRPCFSFRSALVSAPSIDSPRTERGTPQAAQKRLLRQNPGNPDEAKRRLTANLGADRDAAPRATGRYRWGRKPPVGSLTSLIWKEKRRRRRPGDSVTTLSRR
jgi:hypothetical protein